MAERSPSTGCRAGVQIESKEKQMHACNGPNLKRSYMDTSFLSIASITWDSLNPIA